MSTNAFADNTLRFASVVQVDPKGFWWWCILLRITGFFGLCPSSGECGCLGVSKHTSVGYNRDGVCSSELFGLASMLKYR
jgi:hypothetical protein